jgi:hypothetical protein
MFGLRYLQAVRAAWYEKQGLARDVLKVGEMPDPHPAAGVVRIRVAASGINPGDVKKRQNAFGYGMPYARVIPHSDGAGQVDEIGAGSGKRSGATGPNPIARLGPRPSLRWSPWIKWFAYPWACRRNRAPASGSPESRPTAPSTLPGR